VTPRALSLLRGAVSVSILVLLLSRTSLDDLVARAKAGAFVPLTAALLLVVLTALLVSLRWRTLARYFGLALPMTFAVRAVFLGMFGGQALPSTVGTDLVRGWVAARHTGSIRRAAASVIADRLVALFAACLLLAFTYPLLAPAAALASGAVLLGFLFFNSKGVTRHPAPILVAILVAVAIHAIHVLAAAVTAAAYGLDASLKIWLSIIPASLIACAVPVSVNGWGVREAVIVALAAGHGISEADALVISLTLGVLNVVASLPGAYLMLGNEK
jgi:uncharacterized membrane protein YbhN (UPF0104 family)